MIIFVGPSATGKSVIAQTLIKDYHYQKLVTYTTRQPRIGEVDGIDYHFVTEEDFLQKKENHFFFETVIYHHHYYGTSFSSLSQNSIVILEPSGFLCYHEYLQKKGFFVYLSCDETLRKKRMEKRGDNISSIEERIKLDREVFNQDLVKLCDFCLDTTNLFTEDASRIIHEEYQKALLNNEQ